MARYCIAHEFLVPKGATPAEPRDTVASILVNQGTSPNVAVQQALAWMKSHWKSGPFDVTWYSGGGLVNATLHDFRTKNPPLGIAAQIFLFPGRVNTDLQTVSGPEAEKFVEDLDVDFTYAFLSVYAFDLDSGWAHFQYSEEIRLQRACASLYADHKFLFIDSSKFKRNGKRGYALNELLKQANTLTIYTTTSGDDDDSVVERFERLCDQVLEPSSSGVVARSKRDSERRGELRTLRLRIVAGGATTAPLIEKSGYLRPREDRQHR